MNFTVNLLINQNIWNAEYSVDKSIFVNKVFTFKS